MRACTATGACRRPAPRRGRRASTSSPRLGHGPAPRGSRRRRRRHQQRGEVTPVLSARHGPTSARPRAVSRAACPPRASRDPCRALSGPSLSRNRSPAGPSPPSLATARQAIALDLLVEIAARHLQCARSLRHVPVVLLKLAEQKGPFGRLLEIFERCGAQPGRITSAAGRRTLRTSLVPPLFADQALDVSLTDCTARGENEQPFDRIL